MIHVEPELPEGLRGLRSSELCAWLDLGIEHDEDMRAVPVDFVSGEVLSTPELWRTWLRDHEVRLALADIARRSCRRRRRPRARRPRQRARRPAPR